MWSGLVYKLRPQNKTTVGIKWWCSAHERGRDGPCKQTSALPNHLVRVVLAQPTSIEAQRHHKCSPHHNTVKSFNKLSFSLPHIQVESPKRPCCAVNNTGLRPPSLDQKITMSPPTPLLHSLTIEKTSKSQHQHQIPSIPIDIPV